MSFLEIENISKRFQDFWAVRNFSVKIERGEIFGLLGATGSGKSAILRIIAGLETPNTGKIILDGEEITRLKPEKRRVQFVSQNGDLSPRSTVGEIIWQSLKALKVPKDEIKQKVSEALDLIKLSDYNARRSEELSGGERQLIALVRAVVREPGLLLLDDSFSNLDESHREAIHGVLKSWAENSNAAVVYATQNQTDAFAFCDRIAVVEQGEVLQIGSPTEIYQLPETTAVARFIGRNNLIRAARLTSNKAALSEFQTIEGGHRLFVDNVEKSRLGAINQIVNLAIRPENLVLTFGAAFPEDNLLKATITKITPVGATTRIWLDANGLQLEALVIRLIGLKIGDVCLVGLPPNRISVLKA